MGRGGKVVYAGESLKYMLQLLQSSQYPFLDAHAYILLSAAA